MLYLLLTACALGAGGWAWFERPNFSPDRVQLDGEWVIVDHPAWGGRGKTRVRFNSPQWQAWLCKQKQLRLTTARGYVYLQREKRGKHEYWYGYRWSEHGTQASRCYFGRIEQMSVEELTKKSGGSMKQKPRRGRVVRQNGCAAASWRKQSMIASGDNVLLHENHSKVLTRQKQTRLKGKTT